MAPAASLSLSLSLNWKGGVSRAAAPQACTHAGPVLSEGSGHVAAVPLLISTTVCFLSGSDDEKHTKHAQKKKRFARVPDLAQPMRLPEAQAWEACMLPLHYRRPCGRAPDTPDKKKPAPSYVVRGTCRMAPSG